MHKCTLCCPFLSLFYEKAEYESIPVAIWQALIFILGGESEDCLRAKETAGPVPTQQSSGRGLGARQRLLLFLQASRSRYLHFGNLLLFFHRCILPSGVLNMLSSENVKPDSAIERAPGSRLKSKLEKDTCSWEAGGRIKNKNSTKRWKWGKIILYVCNASKTSLGHTFDSR